MGGVFPWRIVSHGSARGASIIYLISVNFSAIDYLVQLVC